jgi:CheY-like chemotaxis protein
MADGGTLTISTSRVTLPAEADHAAGDFIRISVEDQGEGMGEEVLARATEPFYSTKPMGKGTGLGLAQVYGIARQSNGALRIESRIGEGTRVDILLPAVAAPAEQARVQDRGGARLEPRRTATILVVDDDPDVRAFLGDSLESLGHTVVRAASGEEALALLPDAKADLALIDYAMPGIHGAEVARIARQRLPDLPIVFVTGYAETQQLEAALGPGAPVLRKPFTVEELADAVEVNLTP